MSSRLIIIENCEECPRSGLSFLKPRRVCLEMFREDGSECECPQEDTPDWCPLPAVPQADDGSSLGYGEISSMVDVVNLNGKTEAYAYIDGRISVINEILRGKK